MNEDLAQELLAATRELNERLAGEVPADIAAELAPGLMTIARLPTKTGFPVVDLELQLRLNGLPTSWSRQVLYQR